MNDIRKKKSRHRAGCQDKDNACRAPALNRKDKRAENALVKQLDCLDGKNIRKIAVVSEGLENEDKILHVAAYFRVSTDDIDQAISITFQNREYKERAWQTLVANMSASMLMMGFFEQTQIIHRQRIQKLMKDSSFPLNPYYYKPIEYLIVMRYTLPFSE